MKRATVLATILLLVVPTFAADQTREQKRLEACGQVLKEILDIPDNLPKDLLDKAECVIVIPSVLKFASELAAILAEVRLPAAPANTLQGRGALRPCSRWKVETSGFNWAVRPRILSYW